MIKRKVTKVSLKMKLDEYFKKYKIHPITFSAKSGICPATIYRILKGAKPHKINAEKIRKSSDNIVTFEAMGWKYETLRERRKRKRMLLAIASGKVRKGNAPSDLDGYP